MTEDQALQTRCCGPNGCGKVADDGSGSPMNQIRLCIGRRCMAWRWEHIDMGATSWIISDTDGFCGLAGRPLVKKETQ